jgi:uncharacterized membrane protein
MLSTEVYKLLHLLGIMLLFASLGGLAVLGLRGGEEREVAPVRKLLTITHGVTLLVVWLFLLPLVGGAAAWVAVTHSGPHLP